MSVRPNVIEFNLKDFLSIFGSKDRRKSRDLISFYNNGLPIVVNEPYDSSEDNKRIEEAVMGTITLKDFELNYPFVFERLPSFTQPLNKLEIHSNDYGGGYHSQYFETLRGKVRGETGKLFSYLKNGRCFFDGESVPRERYPYSYLSLEEINLLLSELLADASFFDDGSEFSKDFVLWLTNISKAKMDLYFSQG